MLIYFIWFAIPVIVWVAICKIFLNMTISWGEAAVQAGVTTAIIAGLFFAAGHSQTSDYLVANGIVERMDPQRESCPRGWRSFRDNFCTEYRTRQVYSHTTCTGTGNDKICTDHYDTEYKYIYPWERRYFVYADYLEPFQDVRYEVQRIDRQGVNTPPRFEATNVGDPTSKHVGYTNYIKGASSSLFAEEAPDEDVVIAYPSIREQWKTNRVLVFGIDGFDSNMWKSWNQEIMQLNTDLRATGANVVIMLTNRGTGFSEMLARAWEAHNINDVVVVIGTDGRSIDWVDARSWSANSLAEIEIRDGILDHGTLDSAEINVIIKSAIEEHFELKSMEEFEYLADDIVPPTWVMVLAGIILVIVTPAVTYLFHRVDLFPQRRRRW